MFSPNSLCNHTSVTNTNNLSLFITFKFQRDNSAILLIVFAITLPIHAHHKQPTAVRQNTALYQRTSLAAKTTGM